VDGAIAIQIVLDRIEWVRQSATVIGSVRHLRKEPLEGLPIKPILVQFAKADQQSADVSIVDILLAGDLLGRATYYRHDVAYAENPALPKSAHGFTFGFAGGGTGANLDAPGVAAIALAAQEQMATFLASDGALIIQPQPVRYFESPIKLRLPDGFYDIQ
jgi:hypothetical protein